MPYFHQITNTFATIHSMEQQRQTKQRELILKIFHAAEGPLTAEEIHARATAVQPQLGVATVYRTLKLLHVAEMITPVDLPGEETHYELTERGHHHHFRCLDCDRWFRLGRCFVALPDGTVLPDGFVIEGHYLALYGRCPTCAAARERR